MEFILALLLMLCVSCYIAVVSYEKNKDKISESLNELNLTEMTGNIFNRFKRKKRETNNFNRLNWRKRETNKIDHFKNIRTVRSSMRETLNDSISIHGLLSSSFSTQPTASLEKDDSSAIQEMRRHKYEMERRQAEEAFKHTSVEHKNRMDYLVYARLRVRNPMTLDPHELDFLISYESDNPEIVREYMAAMSQMGYTVPQIGHDITKLKKIIKSEPIIVKS